MQQLIEQMREERSKLPLPIEWDRAYQSIKMMIEHTYIPLEKEQMMKTWTKAIDQTQERAWNVVRAYDDFDDYYNETYGKDV